MAPQFIVELRRNGKPKRGEIARWFREVALPFVGAECLAFPFSRNAEGRGHISERAYGTSQAHVYVLEQTQGQKPTPRHECCHRCGLGHEGCVNPGHLYWGTRAKNVDDRKVHGVFVPPPLKRGKSNGNAVLQETEARAIKGSAARGIDLADVYGVSPGTVSAIRTGRLWAWL